eukprot:scaffold9098_cov112-Skeletonema_dohrnii-CCMP3373.AAC.4
MEQGLFSASCGDIENEVAGIGVREKSIGQDQLNEVQDENIEEPMRCQAKIRTESGGGVAQAPNRPTTLRSTAPLSPPQAQIKLASSGGLGLRALLILPSMQQAESS